MQQIRAIGCLGVRVGTGGKQRFHRLDRLAIRLLAERWWAKAIESRSRGKRGTASATNRHHRWCLADIRVAASAAGRAFLLLFLDLSRAPFDLRAVREHQL